MTEDEKRAIIRSEGFQWHSREYQEAFWRRDVARQREILAEVERRYGRKLADGLVAWVAEE